MIRRPPISTRTDTLFPYTTLFRSPYDPDGPIGSRPQNTLGITGTRIPEKIGIVMKLRIVADALYGPVAEWKRIVLTAHRSGKLRDELAGIVEHSQDRSEERRVGKECVSTCRSRWLADHLKKK